MADTQKLNIALIGYVSEWALARAYHALFEDPDMQDRFNLVAVAGRQPTIEDANYRITQEIEARECREPGWRQDNTTIEIQSLKSLESKLSCGEVEYIPLAFRNFKYGLRQQDYNGIDAVLIFTPNITHVDYIEEAIGNGKHLMCEKPLVTVYNYYLNEVNRRDLDRLIQALQNSNGLVLKDAEHYSHKQAIMQLYDAIDELVEQHGRIKYAQTYILEKDSQSNPRTRSILSRYNRTGILLDTGIHPLSIIANLGGSLDEIREAKYAIYPCYDVETYAYLSFTVSGSDLFKEDAKCRIEVGKFVKLFNPLEQEAKYMLLVFDDNCPAYVNFSSSGVSITGDDGLLPIENQNSYPKNEYVSSLIDFHDAITRGTIPISNFSKSIHVLDFIARTYERFPVNDARNQIPDLYE